MRLQVIRVAAIRILGAGPAGSAAAIAALSESAAARLFEKSTFPRHKVCGEFLSPGVARILEALGVWQDFLGLRPARIRRCVLHLGSRAKQWTLAECAYGLSRYQFDRLLFDRAVLLGAEVDRDPVSDDGAPTVIATGRGAVAPRGNRLFGFKAHFEGPVNDAVELFFFEDCYVGVSAVEDGITNVCGIAPESTLRRFGFQPDELLARWQPLGERLAPLTRNTRWLTTGPLLFSRSGYDQPQPAIYPAGDALGFVDPFTGTGMLNALLTGRMAGLCAARRVPGRTYLRHCARLFEAPFRMAALFRTALRLGWVVPLARYLPGSWLFRLTRAAEPDLSWP
jgi:flavin-dependent dehydrogenase